MKTTVATIASRTRCSAAEGIRDVSLQQNLIEAMRGRSSDDATIRKVAYRNWLCVMEKTWGE